MSISRFVSGIELVERLSCLYGKSTLKAYLDVVLHAQISYNENL